MPESRKQFFKRLKKNNRPEQQEASLSVEERDGNFIHIEAEETVIPDPAKHNVAVKEKNNDESKPQNKQRNPKCWD